MSATRRVLIRGGLVLSMAKGAEPMRADVLTIGDRIDAVAPNLAVEADEIVDAQGAIVVPGFVDAHRHVWQSSLKGLVPNETLKDYFRSVRFQGSLVTRPEDTYISTLAGALEAIDAGVTTVLDFNNNVSSPETAEASIAALQASGLRARFGLGMNDTFGQVQELATREGRLRLLHDTRETLASDDALVTLMVALSDLPEVGIERITTELRAARELGLRSTTNSLAILFHEFVDDIAVYDAAGLIGPDLLWVHNIYATESELRRAHELGSHTVTCPDAELGLGMGRPATHRVLASGAHPAFGCDTVSSVTGDLRAQARTAMLVARQLANDEEMQRGHAPERMTPTAETALRALTIWGAEAVGLEDRIGTIEVGKQADLVVIRTDRPGVAPVNDPYAAVVVHSDGRDIDTVLVGGVVRKRAGRLVEPWSPVRERLQASRDGLVERVAEIGGWNPSPAVPLPW